MEDQDKRASDVAQEPPKWTRTADRVPTAGLVVHTKIDTGGEVRNEQKLRREGALWFTPDMGMYVYYTPTHWRA